ncbi:TPA: ATP-binding cassette domain-containing protein, partial [Listeria monocytogenes]
MSDSLFQLEKVGFQANGKQILQDISFTVNKGEVIVFSGPSGSGKSTLLKLIGTLLSPTSGKIYYRGTDLQKIDPVEYRKEVSYFFQNASLFDETVQENLSFPARIREEGFDRERAKKLLERVQIPETYLSKEVKELSG